MELQNTNMVRQLEKMRREYWKHSADRCEKGIEDIRNGRDLDEVLNEVRTGDRAEWAKIKEYEKTIPGYVFLTQKVA